MKHQDKTIIYSLSQRINPWHEINYFKLHYYFNKMGYNIYTEGLNENNTFMVLKYGLN